MLLNSAGPFDSLIVRLLFGAQVYRFDYSNKLRAPAQGRLLVSKETSSSVMKTLDSYLPLDLSPEENLHQTLEESFSKPGTKFLLFEVASTDTREVGPTTTECSPQPRTS